MLYPPSAPTFDGLTCTAHDMQGDVTAPCMLHWLQKGIKLIEAAVSSRPSTVQRQYKHNFDKIV